PRWRTTGRSITSSCWPPRRARCCATGCRRGNPRRPERGSSRRRAAHEAAGARSCCRPAEGVAMPRVSVIVPAYNAARFIGAAVSSAVAQTFADLEVIVVDDGSRDETAAVVESIARVDRRVRLLRQENGGVSSARNAALRISTGEYLALLDGDDVWNARFLEEQV